MTVPAHMELLTCAAATLTTASFVPQARQTMHSDPGRTAKPTRDAVGATTPYHAG